MQIKDSQCRPTLERNKTRSPTWGKGIHPEVQLDSLLQNVYVWGEPSLSLSLSVDFESVNYNRTSRMQETCWWELYSKTKSGCHKKSDIGIRGKDTDTHKWKYSTMGRRGEEEQMQQHKEKTQRKDLQSPYVAFFLLAIKSRKTG